jgi:hypothetical protein
MVFAPSPVVVPPPPMVFAPSPVVVPPPEATEVSEGPIKVSAVHPPKTSGLHITAITAKYLKNEHFISPPTHVKS